MSNPDLELLTSTSSFNLADIRKRKTAIFIKTPPQYTEYYAFFISIIFRSVFNMCMRQLPSYGTLPVYCLMDEFGHMTLPNFVSTANTIRGYKVSLSIILQSLSQLSDRYGEEYAKSIQGGLKNYLTYAGSDASTRLFFEELSGKTVIHERQDTTDMRTHRQEFNLMNAGELRTLPEHQAYVVTGNMHPMVLSTLPYFSNRNMLRKIKVGYSPKKKDQRPYSTSRVPLD
jgi:type IV secretory pathway TraG/TraD family ATPase VirD4